MKTLPNAAKKVSLSLLPILVFLPLIVSAQSTPTAWIGATIWDGTGGQVIENGVLLVDNDRITSVYPTGNYRIPEDATIIDVTGKYIIPGLINSHGHIGSSNGLQAGPSAQTRENVMNQLRLSALYGITTVVSLGGAPSSAFDIRNESNFSREGVARLHLAGPVLNPSTTQAAVEQVTDLMAIDPDWVKIRVDDNLDRGIKMPTDVSTAVTDAAHQYNKPLAVHIVELSDAKDVIRNGADLLAHSVRDNQVDDELIQLMSGRNICITPTLTREVSVFIYASRPEFFDDPYFLKLADPTVLEQLQQPEVQQNYAGETADYYQQSLPTAISNMMTLHNAGIRIAMGTDSGMPARFQGYFEQMEMEMMQDAGMIPEDVLLSATRNAAECMRIDNTSGTLQAGKFADFLILNENPLENVRNLREIDQVIIGGSPVR